MAIDYRPRSVPRILDGALALYRANLKPVALASLALLFPAGLVSGLGQVLLQRGIVQTTTGAPSLSSLGIVLLSEAVLYAGIVVAVLAQTWLASALLYLAPGLAAGRVVTAREVLAAGRHRFWTVLGISIVSSIVAGTLVGIPVAVFWAIAPAAAVVEGIPLDRGLSRSWRILRRVGFWRTALLFFGVYVVTVGIEYAILAPGAIAQLAVTAANPEALVTGQLLPIAAIQGLLTALSAALAAPFTSLATYFYYTDSRSRAEGMDLVMRAAELGAAHS